MKNTSAETAVTELHPVHEAHLLTYLKLDRKSLGLLVNFNVPILKQGDETGGRSSNFRLLSLPCASVPLWFKSQI